MYDKDLVCDILYQILQAAQKVSARFKPITSSDAFINSPEGMGKLDSICMQLIAIGGSLKKIEVITNKTLLSQYPEIDWNGAKGLRAIITHHYFDINAEEIFLVGKKHLPNCLQQLSKS